MSVNDFEGSLSSSAQELNRCLDRLDYGRLRGLAYPLQRSLYMGGSDWDLPPVILAHWIEAYSASHDAIRVIEESGIQKIVLAHANEIRKHVSGETLPIIDSYLVPLEALEVAISEARTLPALEAQTLMRIKARQIDAYTMGGVLVVDTVDPGNFPMRYRVDEKVGQKRLKIGALIAKAASGAALAVGNVSLGVFGGVFTLPALAVPATVGIAAGIVTSAYTGLVSACDALDKIADEARSKNS